MSMMYDELAYLEHVIATPEAYAKDSEIIVSAIRKTNPKARTMLHLASGAGINDFHFKKHFQVTGLDLSLSMIREAKKLNPEITYHHGDMTAFSLKERFDVVVIPDAIMHIVKHDDLERIFACADKHLNKPGILAIVYQPRETYRDNNFVYSGKNDEYDVTVFENNHRLRVDLYEAVITYVIRHQGITKIHHDVYELGLFTTSDWEALYRRHGFATAVIPMNDIYDEYVQDGGAYPLNLHIGIRTKDKT